MTQSTRAQVRRVLIITLILNITVASGKILLGLLTGALAITADGFHSLTDSAGNVAGLVATVYANRPPDDTHPYGHRRFETLAALLIGILLILTAWELIQGLIERLTTPHIPDITPLTFAILIITLVINIFVSRYQIDAGERLNSQILLADAKNTRADVFVTLSVLVSMALIHLTGIVWLDVLAATIVIVLIVRAAWEIIRDTGRVLVDSAPISPDTLTSIVADVPSVTQVNRARSRGSSDAIQVDVEVQVAPETTTNQTDQIAQAIRDRLMQTIDGVSAVEVYFSVPESDMRQPALAARAYADQLGLATHEVQIGEDRAGTVMELHVEVPPDITLGDAHERVSQLEAALIAHLPDVDRVVTHIEPAPPPQVDVTDALAHTAAIEARADVLLKATFPAIGWHDLAARCVQGGYALVLHATLPAQTSIEQAHQIAESAETLLRARLVDLVRVTIHTEPAEG